MKRYFVVAILLFLSLFQSGIKTGAEDNMTDIPSPTMSAFGGYYWEDKNQQRTSGIFTYQILDETEKKAAITKVNEAVKDLTIPAVLDGYNIVSVGQIPVEGNNVYEKVVSVNVSEKIEDTLETLTISEGIQHVGYYSFYKCKKLTVVNLPENLCCVGDGAFEECTSLKKLYLPKTNVKYGIDIMEAAFARCTSLESVILVSPDFQNFQYSCIRKLILSRTEDRYFNLDLEKTTVGTIFIDPYVKKVFFVEYYPQYNYIANIEKIIVNGKKTKLKNCSSKCKLGALYTVPMAKCISWAKKYKQTYKVKSCGRMGKVTKKKQKAAWEPVKTSVKTFLYNKKKKKWKTTSRKVKTYYKVYGKNSKKETYKLIKTTDKTSCKTKCKYLKVQPVATWE